MAAAIVPFIPLILMIPDLIKDVQEMIAIARTPELSPEEREARLNAIDARLTQRLGEIAAMQLPARRTD
jgi:hypothetical protein